MGQGIFRSSYFYDLSSVKFSEHHKSEILYEIQNEPFIVFSKSYCPYCLETKRLLDSHDVTAVIYREINLEDYGLETQAILYNVYGQKTVPNIFIKGRHIGGNAELHKMAKTGELKKLLDEAGIENRFH